MLQRRSFMLGSLVVIAATAWSTPGADADPVLEWNEIMLTTLQGQSPLEETRLAAITHLAMFEAVNAITREYKPYLGSLAAPQDASAEAAAITAAHGVLRHYVPARAGELDAARLKSLASVADGPAKTAGIVVGEQAAQALTAARAGDGASPAEFYLPMSTAVGAWQLTPSCPPAGGLFYQWRNVKPFGIDSARRFRAPPPPPLTSRAYARAHEEVRRVGGNDSAWRPQERADVARLYAVLLPMRTWNPVARQLATARGTSLSENARIFALLNMAMSDGLVAVLESKYHWTAWRPETAIRAGDEDGNRFTRADPDFEPFIATPCHPSYPSAHATGSYAALAVLERIFGGRGFITVAAPGVPDVSLAYRSLEKIAADIDDARVYGGIHFRFDQEAGARQGLRVGKYIYQHLLRPVYARWGADDDESAGAEE